eukprot:CAMPEP_0178789712 /NCGR_PEP_ID=MMETSP0745-20121128/7043_1 /TAXON_ID=913974 /ORGANISM="Nitzschia punctata, Strain CCMP561" /LENGTH=456 /DNA_ID=CAMNT_0020447665 /DNA_START=252 /DNA_END=1622 /DNA_ORIENTATION=-
MMMKGRLLSFLASSHALGLLVVAAAGSVDIFNVQHDNTVDDRRLYDDKDTHYYPPHPCSMLLPADKILYKYCSTGEIFLFEETSSHYDEPWDDAKDGEKGGKKKDGEKKGEKGGKKKDGEKGGKKDGQSDDCMCQAHILGISAMGSQSAVDVTTTDNGDQTMFAFPVFDFCQHYDLEEKKPIGVLSVNDYTVNDLEGKLDNVNFRDGALTIFGKRPVTFAFVQQGAVLDDGGANLISNGRADIVGGTGSFDSGFIQYLPGLQVDGLDLILVYGCKDGYDDCALPDGAETLFKSPFKGGNICVEDPTPAPTNSIAPSSQPSVSIAPTLSEAPSDAPSNSAAPSVSSAPTGGECVTAFDCIREFPDIYGVGGDCPKCVSGVCEEAGCDGGAHECCNFRPNDTVGCSGRCTNNNFCYTIGGVNNNPLEDCQANMGGTVCDEFSGNIDDFIACLEGNPPP